MSKPPVTIGCAVMLSPGMAGPPDSGVITMIPQPFVTANGMPLAVSGSICQMINSVSGAPYPLPIGVIGCSSTFTVNGQGLVRLGDLIPAGRGVRPAVASPWWRSCWDS